MKRMFRVLILVVILTMANVSPAQGDSLPDSAYVSGGPSGGPGASDLTGHAQGYSLSCESRSAADWAAFWGVNFSETEFLDALPRSDNPDEGFVGSPTDAWGRIPPAGYGVHADPVAETLQQFGLPADARLGLTWDDLRYEISEGRPVIVWVIGQMWDGTPLTYKAVDGRIITVAHFEHTMILTGYSPDAVQLIDAYSGQYQAYWLKAFLKSWAVLGNMAVVGPATPPQVEALQPEAQAGVYTVQEGESLVELAERFGTTWQELAEFNSIGYPFTIFPGQVLQVPGGEVSQAGAEPAPAQPRPASQGGVYQVHLPMVQRNYADMLSPAADEGSTTPTLMDTVTVSRAGTLPSFGESIGVDWRLLVKLNDLRPPYIVQPGQVLRLR